MLCCAVRDCHLALTKEGKQWRCEKGHSFDIARSGYVNLLQPQERRSKNPGDTAEAVAGRRRLHDLGVTAPLYRGLADLVQASDKDVVLDAGCGEGFYLGSLSKETACEGHGIDISIPAIDAAARRYPTCEWIVGNADRSIPYTDRSFSIVMSITARMNPAEFRRVLRSDGRLLVAIPAPDDLIELRGKGRERVERTAETFVEGFDLIAQQKVTTSAELDTAAVQDVLHAIYRPLHAVDAAPMRVTFSFDLLLFRAS